LCQHKIIKAKKIISRDIEWFTDNAGMMAIKGIINVAIYILLKQNNPSPRFAKFSRFPSFAILFETTLRPDIHRTSSSF